MKVLFINSVLGFGSTGKIVADLAMMDGVEPLVIYGRKENTSNVKEAYKMTGLFGNAISAIETILFDKQGFTNKSETKKLIKVIDGFKPDVVNLHNLHGYYINLEILLNYFKEKRIPVIWTLHDCWTFTGYCPHFDYLGCDKYKSECNKCPMTFTYPFSIFKQNTTKNFNKKKELFKDLENITFVTPSNWLGSKVKESFNKDKKVITLHNGINLNSFKPTQNKNSKFTILFVSSVWTEHKGVDEMIKMIPLLDENIEVIIVGGYLKKDAVFKNRCTLIERTNDVNELVNLYSKSHALINMTLEENLPTVNIEALACGTPVITYNTGGSPEIIDEKTGIVVEKYNYVQMAKTISDLKNNYNFKVEDCLERSKLFDKKNMLNNYKELFEEIVNGK